MDYADYMEPRDYLEPRDSSIREIDFWNDYTGGDYKVVTLMIKKDKLDELFIEFEKIHDEYLKKFGEHSLDYADYIDPRHIDCREYEGAIKILSKAIKRNKPLPNDPPPEGVEYLY